jgi:hypothetical protein
VRPDVQASALGGSIDGMLAEYVVLEEEGVVKIPAPLSVEEGATLPCAALTAWHALVEHEKVIAGQTVLLDYVMVPSRHNTIFDEASGGDGSEREASNPAVPLIEGKT